MASGFRSKVAVASLFGTVLLISLAYLDGVNADICSHVQVLAAAPSPILDPIIMIVLIVTFVILVSVGLALKYRKHFKLIGAAILVIGVVVAGILAVGVIQPSVSYWLVSPDSIRAQDNVLTMYCENSGYWGATFDLVITLDNAHISLKTSPPYTLVNDQTAKFSFTLGPGERQSRQAWYIIDQNVSDFYLDLTFQTSSSGFIKSDPGGVTQVSYQKGPTDTNFTKRLERSPVPP